MGAGDDKRIVLQLDNAGWHGPENLAVPDGIRLVFQPAHSPELQHPGRRPAPADRRPAAGVAQAGAADRALLDGSLQIARQGRAVRLVFVAGPTFQDVLLAEPRGFCAGVDRAIEIVERALAVQVARPNRRKGLHEFG